MAGTLQRHYAAWLLRSTSRGALVDALHWGTLGEPGARRRFQIGIRDAVLARSGLKGSAEAQARIEAAQRSMIERALAPGAPGTGGQAGAADDTITFG